jgi:hypothetical protein
MLILKSRLELYFNKVLKQNQGDKAAALDLRRAAHFMIQRTDNDWTGYETTAEK